MSVHTSAAAADTHQTKSAGASTSVAATAVVVVVGVAASAHSHSHNTQDLSSHGPSAHKPGSQRVAEPDTWVVVVAGTEEAQCTAVVVSAEAGHRLVGSAGEAGSSVRGEERMPAERRERSRTVSVVECTEAVVVVVVEAEVGDTGSAAAAVEVGAEVVAVVVAAVDTSAPSHQPSPVHCWRLMRCPVD